MCFGILQHIVQSSKLLTICRTLWNTHIEGCHRHNVALAVEYIDFAGQFRWWIKQNIKGADVAAIDICIYCECC